MHAIGLLCLMPLLPHPISIKSDVSVALSRRFAIPILVSSSATHPIARVAIFVSRDEEKSWKHLQDCKPSDDRFIFSAPEDGLYWFAAQVFDANDVVDPETKELTPAQKVYVNSQGRPLHYEVDLMGIRREIWELKGQVSQLLTPV
jgi:hypothetical protein